MNITLWIPRLIGVPETVVDPLKSVRDGIAIRYQDIRLDCDINLKMRCSSLIFVLIRVERNIPLRTPR